jgi:pimeloyl-ACP methyl ester carboxylesterase
MQMQSLKKKIFIGVGALAVLVGTFTGGALYSALSIRASIQDYWRATNDPRTPNGINFAGYVTIGGVKQWITIRGKDKNNPVLLHLHGGPGTAISDVSYIFMAPLEDSFTVVQWDQRGAGRSNLDPEALIPTMTFDRQVDDASEVLGYLQKRFGREKILVFGQSWGAFIGLALAKKHPEQIAAYMAVGQFNNLRNNGTEATALGLTTAKQRGDKAAIASLAKVPPYPTELRAKNGLSNGAQAKWIASFQEPGANLGLNWYNRTRDEIDTLFTSAALMSPTVTNQQIWNVMFGKAEDYRPLDQLDKAIAEFDGVTIAGGKLDIPYMLIQGKYDGQTPHNDAMLLYNSIKAPYKSFHELPYAAHYVWPEQQGLAFYLLTRELMPFAKPAAGPAWEAP